jgi:hypothetical protein
VVLCAEYAELPAAYAFAWVALLASAQLVAQDNRPWHVRASLFRLIFVAFRLTSLMSRRRWEGMAWHDMLPVVLS